MSAADAWVVEFDAPDRACAAARTLREQGFERLDLHAPYEVPGAGEALGLSRPRYLPRTVLVLALLGACTGYGLQWYSSAATPNGVVGARPVHAPPAFVPVTFELAVLFGGLGAFVGLLGRRPLLRLWQPVFEVEGFDRASIDRFWLHVGDPVEAERLTELLAPLEPRRIERVRT